MFLSLSTVVLIVGIDKECMECGIFACLETHLTICFSRKNQLKHTGTAIIMLCICLTKRNVDYFNLRIMNFKKFENHWISSAGQPACQPASQPAIRPGSARCTAPKIHHSKGYPFPFTKLLFRRRFIHCAMVILLYFLSLLSSLSIGMRKQFQHDHNIPYKV